MRYIVHNQTEIIATVTGEGLKGTAIHPLIGTNGILVYKTDSEEPHEIHEGKPRPREKTGLKMQAGKPVPCYAEETELKAVKQARIDSVGTESFFRVNSVYPEYKKLNALMGIYPRSELNIIKKFITDHRAAYYAAVSKIKAAKSIKEVGEIKAEWPKYDERKEHN